MKTDIDVRILLWSTIGFFAGIYLFLNGFRRLWEKRLIQNIPTSKIRSIAMGQVEIQGTAIADVLLTGPYTKSPCVFFHIIEEHLVRTKDSARWVKDLDVKSDIPFFVQDDTGSVMVDPSGAETDLPLRYTNIEGNRRYREWNLMDKEPVYVLGTAKRVEGIEEKIQSEVERRIQEIIENPEEKIKLDINKDMWIDEKEWEIAREKIKEQVKKDFEDVKNNLQQSSHNIPGHLQNIVIGKGELDRHFLISNKSEKELVNSYKYRVFFSIFGGVVLSLVCLKILIYYIFKIIIK
ncbi:MAG TPA: hypothetical protein PLQ41_00710 [bacterium]|nr:hypothetical protein [bacterium]HPP29645.1 hypothetical protein [bacterium]